MINIEVFDLLLEAIKTGTTLVLVGDINQLESVGAGAVLHDLLEAPESLIPRTMLTDVFRQKGDSSIILMLSGLMPESLRWMNDRISKLFIQNLRKSL